MRKAGTAIGEVSRAPRPNGGARSAQGPLRGDAGPGYVVRTLAALELLAPRPATHDELASSLRVHRRTAMRLIDVMKKAGWVEQDTEDRRRLRLTTRIISVAGEVLGRTSLVEIGAPFVRSLRERTSESSHMSVLADGWCVHIIEQPSPLPLNVAAHVGDRVPLYAAAVGKAIAAWSPEQVGIAMRRGFERFTPNTLTTPESLEAEFSRIRQQGYAVDDAELYPDTCCIAAPVRGPRGNVVAAIGISGPAVRITRDRIETVSRDVVDVADALSAALGYEPEGSSNVQI
jgi:DNA-binding IclR family transcriptional regulator